MSGVSHWTLALTSWSTLAWLVYGIRRELLPSALNSVLVLTSVLVIALCVVGAGKMDAKKFTRWLAVLAAFALLWLAVPTAVVGAAATAVGMFFLFPQMVKTVRSVGTSEIRGFGWSSVAMVLFANTLWVLYTTAVETDLWLALSSGMHLFNGVIMLGAKWVDLVLKRRGGRVPVANTGPVAES
jgi:uncharacterized protein with PQ loop repeat